MTIIIILNSVHFFQVTVLDYYKSTSTIATIATSGGSKNTTFQLQYIVGALLVVVLVLIVRACCRKRGKHSKKKGDATKEGEDHEKPSDNEPNDGKSAAFLRKLMVGDPSALLDLDLECGLGPMVGNKRVKINRNAEDNTITITLQDNSLRKVNKSKPKKLPSPKTQQKGDISTKKQQKTSKKQKFVDLSNQKEDLRGKSFPQSRVTDTDVTTQTTRVCSSYGSPNADNSDTSYKTATMIVESNGKPCATSPHYKVPPLSTLKVKRHRHKYMAGNTDKCDGEVRKLESTKSFTKPRTNNIDNTSPWTTHRHPSGRLYYYNAE